MTAVTGLFIKLRFDHGGEGGGVNKWSVQRQRLEVWE